MTIASFIFVTLLSLSGGELITNDITNDCGLIGGSQTVQASAGCEDNGFKNWNNSPSWWYPDGMNCWCTEEENVSNPCGGDDEPDEA